MSDIFAVVAIPVVDCEIVDEDEAPVAPKAKQYLPPVAEPRAESAPVSVGRSMIQQAPPLGAFSAEDAVPYVIGAVGVAAAGAILWWGSRPVRQNARRVRSRR